jgi:predicted transcriptional regulator
MSVQPTEVELQILNVLWEQGASTVRQVHQLLQKEKETNYATTVKMLVVMFEKGLVTRDQSVRPQVYKAAITRKSTQKRVLKNVVEKMFAGSASSLVLQALASGKTSEAELDEIQAMVDDLKQRERSANRNSSNRRGNKS